MRQPAFAMLSTMNDCSVDATVSSRTAALARAVIAGQEISRADAHFLFHLDKSADVFELLAAANRIREHFKGNRIHLCSIVNIKAGGCSENCRFCAQSASYDTASPRYGVIDPEPIRVAEDEAKANHVTGLGLVAAWRGLDEGPVLDELCARFSEMKASGKTRPDASLGIIKNRVVAQRLAEAGVECYNHNLETSRRFFPEICTTHSYEERLQTIQYLRDAGIKICSGGILGMGETREDRCDLAFALRGIEAQFVPINILNPIAGTPLGGQQPMPPLEVLQMIACFRFVLPRAEIMVAGGREVNLRDLQSMIFMAGASALMVGNYLTTVNQPVERDLRMIRDLGLDPRWKGAAPEAEAHAALADQP